MVIDSTRIGNEGGEGSLHRMDWAREREKRVARVNGVKGRAAWSFSNVPPHRHYEVACHPRKMVVFGKFAL
jgi:hypothetical protein